MVLRGKVSDWLESYLKDRKQMVDIDGVRSDELDIRMGVPQGSILGPLLFLIFVNDLPRVVGEQKNLTMFADDNSYLCFDTTVNFSIKRLRSMLGVFEHWFGVNRLRLN